MSVLSYFSRVVSLWRESLGKVNQKAAQSLADPTEYENLFQGLKEQFKAEQFLRPQRRHPIPAASFPNVPVCINNTPCVSLYVLSRASGVGCPINPPHEGPF